MYKRCQVLLPDWLEDYVKYISTKYHISFSETVRLELCFAMLLTTMEFFNGHKPNITPQEIFTEVEKYAKGKINKKEFNITISKIYFETRKAVEHMIENETKDP